MNVEIIVDELAFEESLRGKFDEIKIPVQDAMADRMYEIVDGNLGESGEFRPEPWAKLASKQYAKKVGRDYATLRETGRMGTTVDLNRGNYDFASVSCDDEVAMAHQFGLGKLAKYPRPFFPIRDGEVTDEAREACIEAAAFALKEALQ